MLNMGGCKRLSSPAATPTAWSPSNGVYDDIPLDSDFHCRSCSGVESPIVPSPIDNSIFRATQPGKPAAAARNSLTGSSGTKIVLPSALHACRSAALSSNENLNVGSSKFNDFQGFAVEPKGFASASTVTPFDDEDSLFNFLDLRGTAPGVTPCASPPPQDEDPKQSVEFPISPLVPCRKLVEEALCSPCAKYIRAGIICASLGTLAVIAMVVALLYAVDAGKHPVRGPFVNKPVQPAVPPVEPFSNPPSAKTHLSSEGVRAASTAANIRGHDMTPVAVDVLLGRNNSSPANTPTAELQDYSRSFSSPAIACFESPHCKFAVLRSPSACANATADSWASGNFHGITVVPNAPNVHVHILDTSGVSVLHFIIASTTDATNAFRVFQRALLPSLSDGAASLVRRNLIAGPQSSAKRDSSEVVDHSSKVVRRELHGEAVQLDFRLIVDGYSQETHVKAQQHSTHLAEYEVHYNGNKAYDFQWRASSPLSTVFVLGGIISDFHSSFSEASDFQTCNSLFAAERHIDFGVAGLPPEWAVGASGIGCNGPECGPTHIVFSDGLDLATDVVVEILIEWHTLPPRLTTKTHEPDGQVGQNTFTLHDISDGVQSTFPLELLIFRESSSGIRAAVSGAKETTTSQWTIPADLRPIRYMTVISISPLNLYVTHDVGT